MSNVNLRPTNQGAAALPLGQFSFLRIPVVLRRRGVSRSAHYADIKAGLFPKPVSIGLRSVAHPDFEVDALNAATIAGKSADEIRALVTKLQAARETAAVVKARPTSKGRIAARSAHIANGEGAP